MVVFEGAARPGVSGLTWPQRPPQWAQRRCCFEEQVPRDTGIWVERPPKRLGSGPAGPPPHVNRSLRLAPVEGCGSPEQSSLVISSSICHRGRMHVMIKCARLFRCVFAKGCDAIIEEVIYDVEPSRWSVAAAGTATMVTHGASNERAVAVGLCRHYGVRLAHRS